MTTQTKKNYVHGEYSLFRKIIVYVLLILGLAFFLLPVIWMLSTSLKTLPESQAFPPKWIPSFQWHNFVDVFKEVNFGRFTWNSIWYTIVTVVSTTFFSAFAAFGFARLRARGRTVLFGIVLSTMMLPPQVTMIPQYLIFNKLGLVDSYWPLIIPTIGGSAFTIFLLRQFYMGIPKELDEAVKIDGGGYFTIFFRILLPLSMPGLATAAIMEFMYRWNDLIGPLIYLSSPEKYPLALGLANFTAAFAQTPWNLLMAASIIAILPPLILFFFAQKYFIRGIVISGTKG
ncbi:multiple sugar transport system permease protein [Pullulanibacillus pueri]|uniref:Sugar ABC transporter permease n=1 Tax=Pullulanibacillus pueri TaxID=1437324 RepID=A0A8J2ZUT8_9BACL|nr:carbohydrate ABC transporter permease [Pullulanibacillus pueri]MBM7682102.1 multiple sugar transport system permease protein [Pullulanibacillus pueri]GGH79973.1 sugar ABC transporter permease [Pullulanibacillus pueri]